MVRSIAIQRCEAARERLRRAFVSNGDVYDELPLLLEDIAERFSEEAETFRTVTDTSYVLNTAKMAQAATEAAQDYASYFNSFVYMSRHQPNHRDRYRHLSRAIMFETYPLLASQAYMPFGVETLILERWHAILIRAS